MKIFSYIRTPSDTSESNRNAAKYKMLVALGLLVAGAFFLFAGIPAAHADRGPCSFLGATFTIQYYQTSGTSTPWTNYIADGTGMCTVPNNLSPVVSPGGTIYVLVTVTGGPANTELWYTLDNQAIQLVCTTDASGACSGEIAVVVSPDLVASGQCATVQEKVLFSNTTPTHDSFDGNIIDHIVTGSGCSGVTGTSSISTTVVDETNPASFPPGKAGDSFHDTATLVVFGDSASDPTGTVTYQFFTTGDCSGPSTTSTGTVGGTAASPTVGPSASTGPLQPGSYSFQATYSGDSHYAGSTSSCEPFTVVAFANPPTVSKTATGTYTTTYKWTITKSVDNTLVDTAGGSPATFAYTVTVTPDSGTISAIAVSGTITVTNTNNLPMTVTVTDVLNDGTVCSVTGGSGATISAMSSQSFDYTCSDSNTSLPSSNTATVAWSSGGMSDTTASPPVTISFTQNLVDDTVSVTDTVAGPLGTCSAISNPTGCTFTYSKTYTDPAGTCTSHPNTATFTTNTTGKTGSASQSVTDCQGANLTVTKTATTSFTRTFTWAITKSVDNTIVHTAGGAPATFNYDVSVAHDAGTDSGWTVSGTITVANPNNWEAITATVTDAIPGGSCTVTGGTSVSILASSSMSFPYSCSFSSNPGSGTNTATATWDAVAASTTSGSATGTASFAFGSPTTIINGCVAVSDTLGGSLGTVCYTDPSPTNFTYSSIVNGPAGTCTTQSNTATFTTNTNGITGSASQTVKDCQGADLTLTKTATPSNNWSISKSEDQTQIDIASGGTATFHYTIVVDSSGWQVTGTITVSNPNDWEAITTTVTDAVNNGGSCTVAGGSSAIVPASGSISLSYTCTYSTYPTSASGTNTATATWDNTLFSTPDGSATGTASFVFPPVTATDTLPGGSAIGLGTCDVTAKCTFTISFTTTGVAGTCTSYTDTAILSTGQSDSKTGKVCVGIDLTVSKTATPTSTWSISKTIDKTSVTIPQGGTATFTYTIVVTNTGNTVSGTITITNPNDWEAITANVADAVNNGGSCTVASMTVTVPASASVTDAYTCTYSGSPSSSSGMNTATVTWDQTAFHTPDGVATGTASFAFSPVTVTDTLPDGSVTNLGTCSVTSSPCTFNDTFTTSGVNGTCTAYTNTAKIVETGQSASATGTVCVTPPGSVTDTAFCPIPATGFNLVLIQNTTSSYQLRATNPGQFYYNAFYISSSSTPSSTVFTATIPFPFITQGANPIQVFENQPLPTCGSTVPSTNINSQFIISPTSITLSSYSVQNFGSTVTVTFTLNTAIPAGNLLWFAIHLNYGLKGFNYSKGTQTCPTATAVTGPSVTIPCGQSYTFSNSISGSTTVTSTNSFNKDPGFAGVILDQNQNPIPGVTVKIYDNNMNLIGITTTDQNGVYLFQYKYTGQKTTFTIVAILPASISNNYTTTSATQTVTMQSNQLVETNFTFTHK